MNICFVFRYYPLFDNSKDSGIGNYIDLISRKLSRNHSTYILTESDKKTVCIHKKVKIYSLKRIRIPLINKRTISLSLYNFRVAWNLFWLNKKHHFDIIEFANWEVEGFIFALISLIFNFPAKIVCRLHTGICDNDTFNNKIRLSTKIIHFFESLFVRLPNVLLYTSTQAHALRCKKIYKLSSKKVNIIPLGVNLPKMNTKKNIIYSNNRDLRIVFIGRIEDRKGIFTLIKAIPIVLKTEPRAMFYVIGKSSIDFFSVIQKIVPIQFLPHICYLGYINSKEQISYFLKFADICVFPSLYESFGYAIIEAMSYGSVVISTKTGGIPEIITHGLNGFLVLPQNHRHLAIAIKTLLLNARLRKQLSINARSTIKQKFTDDRLCRETERYYLRVMSNDFS